MQSAGVSSHFLHVFVRRLTSFQSQTRPLLWQSERVGVRDVTCNETLVTWVLPAWCSSALAWCTGARTSYRKTSTLSVPKTIRTSAQARSSKSTSARFNRCSGCVCLVSQFVDDHPSSAIDILRCKPPPLSRPEGGSRRQTRVLNPLLNPPPPFFIDSYLHTGIAQVQADVLKQVAKITTGKSKWHGF